MSETTTEPTIEERVRKIVADEMGFDPEDVTANASFVQDLNADSLDLTELVMRCEEEFDIEIPESELDADDMLDKLKTVDDLIAIVKRKTKAV